MSSIRQRKIATQISRILGQLLINKAKNERFNQVTINEVELSADLSYAKAYISVQQPELLSTISTDRKNTEKTSPDNSYAMATVVALNHASAWFQCELAKELCLRKTPRMSFILDTSAQQYTEIDTLLKKALSTSRQ